MNAMVTSLLEQIRTLENQLESELATQHAKLGFGIERGKVLFEQELLRQR